VEHVDLGNDADRDVAICTPASISSSFRETTSSGLGA
jgi:hypothetical protein